MINLSPFFKFDILLIDLVVLILSGAYIDIIYELYLQDNHNVKSLLMFLFWIVHISLAFLRIFSFPFSFSSPFFLVFSVSFFTPTNPINHCFRLFNLLYPYFFLLSSIPSSLSQLLSLFPFYCPFFSFTILPFSSHGMNSNCNIHHHHKNTKPETFFLSSFFIILRHFACISSLSVLLFITSFHSRYNGVIEY